MDTEELELTEIIAFDVAKVAAAKSPANGTPFLLIKAMPEVGSAVTAHAPFTGDHTHAHPAFGGPDGDGDGAHEHTHTHDGDNDHHHEHAEPAGKSTAPPPWHEGAAELVKAALGDPAADRGALLKAIAGRGKLDEQPDIDGGTQAIQLIGKLIGYEAQELAAGYLGETCDISLLTQAAECLKCWLGNEQAGAAMAAMGDGGMGKSAEAEFSYPGALAKRKFTAEQRRKLAADGKALDDGSYPIENAEDLDNAATLARSGHGDVAAAKRLIAKRARELGVKNPLDTEGAAKSTVADKETNVDTVAQDPGGLAKAVEDAVTKAIEPLTSRITDLESANQAQADELAKVKATPLPGGPVLSAVRPGEGNASKKAGLIAKAERQEQLARTMTDQSQAERAAKLAAQYRAEAEQLD